MFCVACSAYEGLSATVVFARTVESIRRVVVADGVEVVGTALHDRRRDGRLRLTAISSTVVGRAQRKSTARSGRRVRRR